MDGVVENFEAYGMVFLAVEVWRIVLRSPLFIGENQNLEPILAIQGNKDEWLDLFKESFSILETTCMPRSNPLYVFAEIPPCMWLKICLDSSHKIWIKS